MRDILLIVFGVGTGLGVLGLCYLTIQRFRRSEPAPDVEEAVPRKSAPSETKTGAEKAPKKKSVEKQAAKKPDGKADAATPKKADVAAPRKADVPKTENGGDAKKVKPPSRKILGVEVQAVAAEKTVTTGGADKKTVMPR